MNRHRIGVIGAGIMGTRIIEAMRGHGGYEVAAVYDPQPQALQRARAIEPNLRVAASAEELANLPGLDAIYIASPPGWHLAHMRAAFICRLPVLCEKPLASSLADANAIAALAREAALPCAVNFPFACSPACVRLAQAAASGMLGRIEQAKVTLRFSHWPRAWQEGASGWLASPDQGGFTREVLSHFLFLALRLFGPLELASARLQREPGKTETRLAARLLHASGTLVVDAAVEGDIADSNRLELRGSRGTGVLSDWYRLELPEAPPIERTSPTPALLDAFARMLDGEPDHGLATVGEALAVARLVEALLQVEP